VASGQFRLRLPAALHEALVREAESQGVSLNTLAVALLAGGIGFRTDREPELPWCRQCGAHRVRGMSDGLCEFCAEAPRA
jgi:HicB family